MVNIEGYTTAAGMFLKAKDVIEKPNAQFAITEQGKMETSEKFGNERLHLGGVFDGEEKTFDCSKTNARFISGKVGMDTSKWIGAKLVLETYRTKTSDGKMTDALNVKEVIKG